MESRRVSSGDLAALASKMEMRRILQCPVCQEVPFPPIYQCLNGHSICKNCDLKLNICPQCQAQFSETRNFLAEEIILSSQLACNFKPEGCPVVKTGYLIAAHMQRCVYGPRKCPYYEYDDCTLTSLKTDEVKQHIILNHDGTRVSGNSTRQGYIVSKENGFGPPTVLEFHQNEFLLGLMCRNSTFFFFILFIGEEDEARKYSGTIVLESEKVNGLKLTWNFPIKSTCRRTLEEFAFQEPETFKPSCAWEDLKTICLVSTDNPNELKIKLNFEVSRIVPIFGSEKIENNNLFKKFLLWIGFTYRFFNNICHNSKPIQKQM